VFCCYMQSGGLVPGHVPDWSLWGVFCCYMQSGRRSVVFEANSPGGRDGIDARDSLAIASQRGISNSRTAMACIPAL